MNMDEKDLSLSYQPGNSTQNDFETIQKDIVQALEEWDTEKSKHYHNVISKLTEVFSKLYEQLYEKNNEANTEALHRQVFDRIHDVFLPKIRGKYLEEDLFLFEKCKFLCDINVSAEQFGADENHAIPLSASVVELSVIDNYKSPIEKMDCLVSTYDLVFAQLKTAIISMISKNPERENEIPIVNNNEIIPVLMVVIIKSKLRHLPSTLFYIKTLYYKLEANRIVFDIFKAFETATNELKTVDIENLQPKTAKIKQSIDLLEIINMTSNRENVMNRTLIDEENERTLNLITTSTSEDILI